MKHNLKCKKKIDIFTATIILPCLFLFNYSTNFVDLLCICLLYLKALKCHLPWFNIILSSRDICMCSKWWKWNIIKKVWPSPFSKTQSSGAHHRLHFDSTHACASHCIIISSILAQFFPFIQISNEVSSQFCTLQNWYVHTFLTKKLEKCYFSAQILPGTFNSN